MKEPIFSNEARRQLKQLRLYDQRRIVGAIRKHLIDADPCEVSRNKFRLRRTSLYADFELRVGNLRVFYRAGTDGTVYIALIGKKERNRLVIDGEEFEL